VNLTVTIRKEGKVAMLCLAGTLTVHSVRLARGSIQKQMKEDTDSFCFDLSALDRIDSAGLGELISVYSSFRKGRSLARFRKLSSGFRDLLQIARL
jgi:anti-anti-sigma factor